MAAYRAGNVTIANAIGTGIADDKSIYPYVPDMIRFYLGEEPLIDNVPTRVLRRPGRSGLHAGASRGAGGEGSARRRWLRHADRAAWPARKRSRPSAPASSPTRRATSRSRRWRCPPARRWSTRVWRRAISICVRSCCPARTSPSCPGGLTRVALREGSLVVNSSQGGGTKDTWVLEQAHRARRCLAAPPITCTGWRAIWNAPKPWPACWRPSSSWPCCHGRRNPPSARAVPRSWRWAHMTSTTRAPGRLRRCAGISRLRSRISGQHRVLHFTGAGECARGARHHRLGGVGNHQCHLARDAHLRTTQGRRAQPQPVRIHPPARAHDPRRACGRHAARRGLPFHAHRRLPRAR